MGRPSGTKNIMRGPKEKLKIVLEYRNTSISIRAIAKKYNTSQGIINSWTRKYENDGIKGFDSKTGKHNNPNSGIYNRHPSETDKLKEDLLKKEIELMRLKKGYMVKGVGARKEYVSISDLNMR